MFGDPEWPGRPSNDDTVRDQHIIDSSVDDPNHTQFITSGIRSSDKGRIAPGGIVVMQKKQSRRQAIAGLSAVVGLIVGGSVGIGIAANHDSSELTTKQKELSASQSQLSSSKQISQREEDQSVYNALQQQNAVSLGDAINVSNTLSKAHDTISAPLVNVIIRSPGVNFARIQTLVNELKKSATFQPTDKGQLDILNDVLDTLNAITSVDITHGYSVPKSDSPSNFLTKLSQNLSSFVNKVKNDNTSSNGVLLSIELQQKEKS